MVALTSGAEGGGGAAFAASAAARASSSAHEGRQSVPGSKQSSYRRVSLPIETTDLLVPAHISVHPAHHDPVICTYLKPVCGQRVHVHHVQPACETLVEGSEGVAEAAEAVDVCVESLGLVDELGHDGLDEAEAVGGIWVLLGAGEGEEGALRDAAEWSAVGRVARHGG